MAPACSITWPWLLVRTSAVFTISNNCPTILAGGGANLKLGQHMVLPKDTPLCNVWLTMLNGMGIDVERHGDSSGVVKELRA